MSNWRLRVGLGIAAGIAIAVPAGAVSLFDVGKSHQDFIEATAPLLYGGIGKPLSATEVPVAGASGGDSVRLASGLKVEKVYSGEKAGPAESKLYQNADMIAFWPSDRHPEWAIVCIENGPTVPGVQRLKLTGPDEGKVETILKGTTACDGIRRTPWNTILATEEVGNAPAGNAIEIYDPTSTSGVTIDRAAGTATGADAANVKFRPALGRFAWEGIQILADGTVYAGDELRPTNRANGGAMFKFVSDQKPGGSLDLSDPANAAASPFAAGKLYALEIGGDGANRGQGNQTGFGKWVGPIDPAIARAEGVAKGTGFYRPEDLHADPMALARGIVKVCWANTGDSAARNYAEVLCLTDRAKADASTGAQPEVQPFVLGNPAMTQFDNLDFQPKTGILYVIEDTPVINGEERQGDIWACLPDGADRDLQTDGCVLVVSVRTLGSEPTGFIFEAGGRRAYLNIQHSPDSADYDEMLVIGSFEPERALAVR